MPPPKKPELVETGVLHADRVDVDADHPLALATQATKLTPPPNRIIDKPGAAPAAHIEHRHLGGEDALNASVEGDGAVAIGIAAERAFGVEALKEAHGFEVLTVVSISRRSTPAKTACPISLTWMLSRYGCSS